jgi:hypothetical protein
VFAAFTLVLLVFAGCDQPAAPTVILYNADVFTADPAQPRATAIAIRDEHIVAVGSNAEIVALAGDETSVIDLAGRLVVPGLNDAHVHVRPWPDSHWLTLGASPDADPVLNTVLDSLRIAVGRVTPNQWIMGWVGPSVLDDPGANRDALDAISPAHPVLLSGFTGHGLILNTAALRALDIPDDAPDMPGGWYGRGEGTNTLDGRVWEYAHVAANGRLTAAQPQSAAVAEYQRLANVLLRWGVTSIQHMENSLPVERTLAALQEARVPIRWSIYDWPMPRTDVGEARPDVSVPADLPRVHLRGSKWMLDGTPVERGAVMREPYADRRERSTAGSTARSTEGSMAGSTPGHTAGQTGQTTGQTADQTVGQSAGETAGQTVGQTAGPTAGQPDWYGRLNFSHDEIRQILQSALEDDRQLAFHVSGDSALAVLLTTMIDLAPAERWRSLRIRVEHGDGTMPDLVPLMADLGVVLVQNPLHFGLPHYLLPRLGSRAPNYQLLHTPLEAGVPVAFGADAGGSAMNPFLNIMLAVMHPTNPAEALTLEQAVAAYTSGAAYAEGTEDEKGTLAPGMLADLAVLSQNIFDVPVDALPATESVFTMIGGEIVYQGEGMHW